MKPYGQVAHQIFHAIDSLKEQDPDFMVSDIAPSPYADDSQEFDKLGNTYQISASQGGVPVKIDIRIGKATI